MRFASLTLSHDIATFPRVVPMLTRLSLCSLPSRTWFLLIVRDGNKFKTRGYKVYIPIPVRVMLNPHPYLLPVKGTICYPYLPPMGITKPRVHNYTYIYTHITHIYIHICIYTHIHIYTYTSNVGKGMTFKPAKKPSG